MVSLQITNANWLLAAIALIWGNLQRFTFKLSGAIFKQSMTVLGSKTWGTAQRNADWILPLHPYCTLVWPQSKLEKGRLWWQPFSQSWRATNKLALLVSAAAQFNFPSSNFLKISVAESGYGLVVYHGECTWCWLCEKMPQIVQKEFTWENAAVYDAGNGERASHYRAHLKEFHLMLVVLDFNTILTVVRKW